MLDASLDRIFRWQNKEKRTKTHRTTKNFHGKLNKFYYYVEDGDDDEDNNINIKACVPKLHEATNMPIQLFGHFNIYLINQITLCKHRLRELAILLS